MSRYYPVPVYDVLFGFFLKKNNSGWSVLADYANGTKPRSYLTLRE